MVCGIFCDPEKAFDCVNHKILSQLEYYAITGKAQHWFESYFQNGYQGVKNYKSWFQFQYLFQMSWEKTR